MQLTTAVTAIILLLTPLTSAAAVKAPRNHVEAPIHMRVTNSTDRRDVHQGIVYRDTANTTARLMVRDGNNSTTRSIHARDEEDDDSSSSSNSTTKRSFHAQGEEDDSKVIRRGKFNLFSSGGSNESTAKRNPRRSLPRAFVPRETNSTVSATDGGANIGGGSDKE